MDKKEIPSILERREKVFDDQSCIAHKIFNEIPEDKKITEKTEQGIRVLVARYPDTYKIYFYKYISIGEPSFPRGGIKVWNTNYNQMQCFYYESVALHPIMGYHRFDKEENY